MGAIRGVDGHQIRYLNVKRDDWRRRADSNRRIEVLQTPALGHLATSPQKHNHLVVRSDQ